MNRTATQRFTARGFTTRAAGPIIAAGILLGSLTVAGPAIAGAEPMDNQCTSMTMPDGQPATGPNALTRAGQVGAASQPSASDGSMPVNCQPASHG
jgi:hypothetical protein